MRGSGSRRSPISRRSIPEIGRQIVEEEQGGMRRADYGKQLLIDLSQKLTARFGRGWGPRNLRSMRQFYLMYSPVESMEGDLANGFCQIDVEEIHNSVEEIQGAGKSAMALRKSASADLANGVCQIPKFTLGWSHYLLLMRIADPVERAFYEREATLRDQHSLKSAGRDSAAWISPSLIKNLWSLSIIS